MYRYVYAYVFTQLQFICCQVDQLALKTVYTFNTVVSGAFLNENVENLNHKTSLTDNIILSFYLLTLEVLEATGMPELAPAWLDLPVAFDCAFLFNGMPLLLPGTGIEDRGFPNISLLLWMDPSLNFESI